MNDTQFYTGAAAMVLGAIGMWLMLPRGRRPGRWLGAVFGLVSLVLFGSLGSRMGSIGADAAFASLAGVTIVAAAATVTFRSPVYCALWFALSLLGTAGLFLMQGAQFLGVATIVVYAGAILVTFLFVIMLAQPSGDAYYDRVSWEGMLSAATGAVIVFFLTMLVTRVLNPYVDRDVLNAVASFQPQQSGGLELGHVHSARLEATGDHMWRIDLELNDDAPMLSAADQDLLRAHLLARHPTLVDEDVSEEDFELLITAGAEPVPLNNSEDRRAHGAVLAEEHVATLGAQLFSRHLVAIEVAGTLLLVALVGAIAIVQHAAAGQFGHSTTSSHPRRRM
jgi:NADH-quinone oxidoreductase subunit J